MAMPRVQAVVLPLLWGHEDNEHPTSVHPSLAEAKKIGSWTENINHREFPLINIRRLGGFRHRDHPTLLSLPVIEMTVYHDGGQVPCESLYEAALEVLYDAVRNQTQTEAGYLRSIRETLGATQFSSPYMDSWRVQGLIELGLRPPRN